MNQQPLPGASASLTWGILSIVLTIFCCGPFGFIFSIVGLSKAKTAQRLYEENPNVYTDYSNVKTGKILSYIGIALSVIYLILTILYFGFIVAMVSSGEFNNY